MSQVMNPEIASQPQLTALRITKQKYPLTRANSPLNVREYTNDMNLFHMSNPLILLYFLVFFPDWSKLLTLNFKNVLPKHDSDTVTSRRIEQDTDRSLT